MARARPATLQNDHPARLDRTDEQEDARRRRERPRRGSERLAHSRLPPRRRVLRRPQRVDHCRRAHRHGVAPRPRPLDHNRPPHPRVPGG